MAGFETIVRPVILPNIRPKPKQSVRPQEESSGDPEKGMCVIRGTSGEIIQLPYSFSVNTTRSIQEEKNRYIDKSRVSQQDDDGSVNKDNFIDTEPVNRMGVRGGKQPVLSGNKNVNYGGGMSRGDRIFTYYKRQQEAANIEIKERDVEQKNTESTGN